MMLFRAILGFSLLIFSSTGAAIATADQPHNASASQLKDIEKYHELLNILEAENEPLFKVSRPFAEYESTGYLLFDGSFSWTTSDLKMQLAEHLPEGVKLVVLASSSSEALTLKSKYEKVIDADRLFVVNLNYRAGFWSRDGLPVPVFAEDIENLRLVGARYYHGNEPDQRVADEFGVPLHEHSYYFEGGNFMPDSQGNCWIIDKSIPDSILEEFYGCRSVNRLPHLKGIGHIDESLKFLSDRIALTDLQEYVPLLEEAGFEVHLMPRPTGNYETYMNSLLIHNTIYVPIFNEPADYDAISLYESFGLNVIPLDSSELSKGKGSIHCITMTYPPSPVEELAQSIAGDSFFEIL